MIMRKTGFFFALLAATLTGCGGGDPADDAFQPGQPTTPVVTQVASLSATTSSPTIPSDGSTPADIKVFAKNANNQFVSGVPITISASSGGLNVTTGTTDASGQASATLTPAGDPTRRTITVTATAGTVSTTVNVDVVGSVLTVQGPAALTLQQTGTYTVTLVDAGNAGIVGRTVTVASARNNALTATSVTTNAQGRATFNMTVSNGSNDTITVATAGLTATQAVAVNADAFNFTAPAANTEVALGATQTVTVNWKIAGVAQVGQPVAFSTTRGTVTPLATTTDGSGNATATIQASNAGAAVITATAGTNSSAQLAVEFVAQVPASIDVQPSAFSIGTGQSSTVVAVVRDAAGNLVKNKTVAFTLQDVTGGTLSVGTAVTDSQGRAQTVYTASSTTSANQGVQITATVQGTGLSKTVALTVARRELFISLGTGNDIEELNSKTTYGKDFVVIVTDANGNGVANVPLSVRILSLIYFKGSRVLAGGVWTTPSGTACVDEDVNRNGVLDPGEDFNSSGRIEAGNIAAVTGSATTDATGQATVRVTYPQAYAQWVYVQLSASATVQGTEYVRTTNFNLPGLADDFNNPQVSPPGPDSPFGVQACTSPL
jgi:hypothetical protein